MKAPIALFRDIAFTACADIDAAAAERQARRFVIEARSPKALLNSDDVDIVLNLTIPEAHAEVSLAAIEAGKHVYTEKPLATTFPESMSKTVRREGFRVPTNTRRSASSSTIGKFAECPLGNDQVTIFPLLRSMT